MKRGHTVRSWTVPETSELVDGSTPIWPEQKTRLPSRMACDRKEGGDGAFDERMAVLVSDILDDVSRSCVCFLPTNRDYKAQAGF